MFRRSSFFHRERAHGSPRVLDDVAGAPPTPMRPMTPGPGPWPSPRGTAGRGREWPASCGQEQALCSQHVATSVPDSEGERPEGAVRAGVAVSQRWSGPGGQAQLRRSVQDPLPLVPERIEGCRRPRSSLECVHLGRGLRSWMTAAGAPARGVVGVEVGHWSPTLRDAAAARRAHGRTRVTLIPAHDRPLAAGARAVIQDPQAAAPGARIEDNCAASASPLSARHGRGSCT